MPKNPNSSDFVIGIIGAGAMVVDSALDAECTKIEPVAQPRIDFRLTALILRWWVIDPWCCGIV